MTGKHDDRSAGQTRSWSSFHKRLRASSYDKVRALRDEGLLHREIAERLDLSISTVQDLLSDPTGEKRRERRRRRAAANRAQGSER
jgi:transposase